MRWGILVTFLLLAASDDVFGQDGCSGTVRCGGSGGGCSDNGCSSPQSSSPGCQMACPPYSCPSPPPCDFCSTNSFSSNGGQSLCGVSQPAPPAPYQPASSIASPQYLPYSQPVPPSPPAQPPGFNYAPVLEIPKQPAFPRNDLNINKFGRAPPGRNKTPILPHAASRLRTRRPRPPSPPSTVPPFGESASPEPLPIRGTDGQFYVNDKAVGIPSIDDGETKESRLPSSTSDSSTEGTSSPVPPATAAQSTDSYESTNVAEGNIPIAATTEASVAEENPGAPQLLGSAPGHYNSVERKLKIDEEPQFIDAIEASPPSNEELLHEVHDLLEESKREAHLLTQLVEEITAMNSIATATNGESTRVQEGLPEVNAIEDGPPSFEDIDIAEEFIDKRAQAARNYNGHPLVEKLEEKLKIPIEVIRIELSTLFPSTRPAATATTPPSRSTFNTPISMTPTTFAAMNKRFHQSVNFTDLLATEQTMVPPASTQSSRRIPSRINFYSLGFATKNLMKNFIKAREEMQKRFASIPPLPGPSAVPTKFALENRTKSRSLETLLHQIKENQEKKRSHAVMPVVKKLMRKFVQTKAAKTHRQDVTPSTQQTSDNRKTEDKAIARTTRTTPTSTTTTTTTTTTVTPSAESLEQPTYVDSDVALEENFKLDGDTAAHTPQGMIVDSDAVKETQNRKLQAFANFNERKAFLEDISKELANMPEEDDGVPQSTAAYRYVEDVYGDVRVVGGQSRTTRRPMEYPGASAEEKQTSTVGVEKHAALDHRPVVRIRTTEFNHLDPRTITVLKSKSHREDDLNKPFKVRVPSVRSQWDRQFKGSRQLSAIRRIPALRHPIDH